MNIPAKPVTRGPKHHFFTYYDKFQWDENDKRLLCMETDFMNRPARPDDTASIGYVTLGSTDFHRVADTRAWCWQQGCMLQWIGPNEILYNDRIGDRFVSIIMDMDTGEKRTLPRPVYTISNDGRKALSLNFARNAYTRPGYGYIGLNDQYQDLCHPKDDGIYLVDLKTGNHQLIISIHDLITTDETMKNATHWVNHLLFNPTDNRFIFLHRWNRKDKGWFTRLYTANPDGSGLFCAPIKKASHFIWYDEKQFLVWADTEELGSGYYFCRDKTKDIELIGEGELTRDGHCTFSPDKKWILTDEYPDKKSNRPLILYKFPYGPRIDIGHFFSDPKIVGEIRCDLHPRWSRNAKMVCIDSVHEGSRQMYVLDISSITDNN